VFEPRRQVSEQEPALVDVFVSKSRHRYQTECDVIEGIKAVPESGDEVNNDVMYRLGAPILPDESLAEVVLDPEVDAVVPSAQEAVSVRGRLRLPNVNAHYAVPFLLHRPEVVLVARTSVVAQANRDEGARSEAEGRVIKVALELPGDLHISELFKERPLAELIGVAPAHREVERADNCESEAGESHYEVL